MQVDPTEGRKWGGEIAIIINFSCAFCSPLFIKHEYKKDQMRTYQNILTKPMNNKWEIKYKPFKHISDKV